MDGISPGRPSATSLKAADVTDLTLDAASTLAECSERWLKACCAAESDRAGEVCVLVIGGESALDAHGRRSPPRPGRRRWVLICRGRTACGGAPRRRRRAVAAACAGVASWRRGGDGREIRGAVRRCDGRGVGCGVAHSRPSGPDRRGPYFGGGRRTEGSGIRLVSYMPLANQRFCLSGTRTQRRERVKTSRDRSASSHTLGSCTRIRFAYCTRGLSPR